MKTISLIILFIFLALFGMSTIKLINENNDSYIITIILFILLSVPAIYIANI